ncbi:hypothetical protein KP002_04415 [Geomonas subterranea]|uniref:hypothetical protein n=1 Tax=Geomonas subterranea TaxID=2847989 RepID=UPI001C47EF65|nr:hypothetical protein [Geomonas subterranea]QXM10366.1 hypothetical protein KP002_04415 [Geomonas subterranea]
MTTLIFLLAFGAAFWKGGARNHVFYIFVLAVQAYYLFLCPVVYFNAGQFYAVNAYVARYFGIGLLQILLHLCFFLIGYWIVNKGRRLPPDGDLDFPPPDCREMMRYRVVGLFAFLYLVIFFNTLSEGFNLIDIIVGKVEENTMGLKGGSYFLQNFADSLITLVIAAYYYRIGGRYVTAMTLVAFPLFLVLGFRYRLILTIFGLFMAYIHRKGISKARVLSYLTVVVVFLYFVMFLTLNRTAFFTHQYDKINYNPADFPYTALVDQARGSMVDFALYQAVADGVVERDNGRTMFLYIVIKAVPANFFPGGEKPYPPPLLLGIDRAISAGREVGEAATALGGLFFGFGYLGIYIGGLCHGLAVGFAQRRARMGGLYGGLAGIAVSLVLFQWLTRGYFPQAVDHLVYLSFPVVALKFMTRKIEKRLNLSLPQGEGVPG